MGLNDKIVNSNIFMDGELEQKSNMYILHNTFSKRIPLQGLGIHYHMCKFCTY